MIYRHSFSFASVQYRSTMRPRISTADHLTNKHFEWQARQLREWRKVDRDGERAIVKRSSVAMFCCRCVAM